MLYVVVVNDGRVHGRFGPYLDLSAAEADAQLVADGAAGGVQVFLLSERHRNPSESYEAPLGLLEELQRGLRWVEEGHAGDGLQIATITDAVKIWDTGQISREKRERMGPWLKRHRVDAQAVGFRPGEPGYPSPGRVAWALWGGDPAARWIGSQGDRPWLHPPRRRNKAPKSDTPAKTRERIRGSAKNAPGTAAADGGKIKLSATTEKAIKRKQREHNQGDPLHRATLRQLRAVYRRGAGAYSTSHSPVVRSRAQWALARVDAFLHLLRTGKPKNPRYTQDDDLIK